MLIQFGVENFGSVDEAQTLSLVASNYYKDLKGNTLDPKLPGMSGARLVCAAALYGPNASGKSTIIKAMGMLRRLILSSATVDPEAPLPANPHCMRQERCKQATKFFVAFVDDGLRFEYEVHYLKDRVVFEGLSAFPLGREQVWFTRTWDEGLATYRWDRPSGNLKVTSELLDLVRQNTLLVSAGKQWNNPQLERVYDSFSKSLHVLNLAAGDGPPFDPGFTARLIHDDATVRSGLLRLLKHADLGVVGAKVDKTEPPQDMVEALSQVLKPEALAAIQEPGLAIALEHSSGTQTVPIEWEVESAGTQRLFALAGPWLDILENGHTVFIDELDASLHPLLVGELLKLLFCPETNPKGAQVVFTTHNPFLLAGSLLRRDQIWFTEKDSEGGTHLYPLSDYRPRPSESLVNGYLAGRYGAIPMIPSRLGL